MLKNFSPRFWLAVALMVAGVVLRVIPHPWNFAPIGAIALFGGAHFERRSFAILTPLLTMFIGDAFIGFHSLMPVIYATYALIAVIGMLLRDRRTSVPAVGGGVLLSATLFYLTTNFAVWMTSAMYAKTTAGLPPATWRPFRTSATPWRPTLSSPPPSSASSP